MNNQKSDHAQIFARLRAAQIAAEEHQNATVLALICKTQEVANALVRNGFVLDRIAIGRQYGSVFVKHSPACDGLVAGACRIDSRGTVMATVVNGVQVQWFIPKKLPERFTA